MPETAVSSSTSSRPSKQYQCRLCDKPFDSAETLNLIRNLNTVNLASVSQLQDRLTLAEKVYNLMKYANSICYGQL